MHINKNSNLSAKISSIQIEKINGVSSIIDGSTKYHKIVGFKTGYGWTKLYGTHGKIDFDETEKDTPSGKVWDQKCILFFPGEDVSNATDFDNYANYRYIVKIIYSNTIVKLFGDKFNPVAMKIDFSSKASGSVITFTRTGTDKAYHFEEN